MADDAHYLSRLQDYYARHRVVPSYSRIGALVGLTSKASVSDLVSRLKSKGFLESSPDKRLKPGRRFFERVSVESVQAGLPAQAPDIVSDSFTIDEHLISNPSKTVLVRVRGDSMVDAGIRPGDIAVVEKDTAARVGDIVVARLGDEFTVKRLGREHGQLILRPENNAFPVIRPKDHSEIFGVVVAVFRKYR